jgi:hypothetical protein
MELNILFTIAGFIALRRDIRYERSLESTHPSLPSDSMP